MSQTGNYIKVDDVLFKVAGLVGDRDYYFVPYGFYIQLISDAFEELNMDSKMLDGHADFKMADFTEHLTIPLPRDSFNIKNIWIYTGDACDFSPSKKVWHKRNFFTNGKGYLANRTGVNTNDPYYLNDSLTSNHAGNDKSLIRYDGPNNVNRVLFWNEQNGNIMLSPSCRAAGTMVHVHYNSSGCEIGEAPIIPRFYKAAIEHYAIETALLFRMANEPEKMGALRILQQTYTGKLDKDGMNGSWHAAKKMARTMSTAEREALSIYLGRAAWATGR